MISQSIIFMLLQRLSLWIELSDTTSERIAIVRTNSFRTNKFIYSCIPCMFCILVEIDFVLCISSTPFKTKRCNNQALIQLDPILRAHNQKEKKYTYKFHSSSRMPGKLNGRLFTRHMVIQLLQQKTNLNGDANLNVSFCKCVII